MWPGLMFIESVVKVPHSMIGNSLILRRITGLADRRTNRQTELL